MRLVEHRRDELEQRDAIEQEPGGLAVARNR
jgi:hypothetical protein